MLDPGSIMATQLGYKAAEKSVAAVASALNYFEESGTLALRLEANRELLKIWGKNSGVEEGVLEPSLTVVHELVQRQLAAISADFEGADKMMRRYGLVATGELAAPPSQDQLQKSLRLMKRSLRVIGVRSDAPTTSPDAADSSDAPAREDPGVLNRIRWGLRDKEKLSEMIASLSVHVSLLNQLLTESQRRKAGEDSERVKIVLVGAIQDAETLEALRQTLGQVPEAAEMVARLDRKAMLEDQPWSDPVGPFSEQELTKDRFRLPRDYAEQEKFLARSAQGDTSAIYLLEKKGFDKSLRPEELDTLTDRIKRLVQLLSNTRTDGFQVPTAVGFIQDLANTCWWLVFRFPLHRPLALIGPLPMPQPLTLLALLDPQLKFRPPLEVRYRLAASICTTFSELYSSNWLHKAISSRNILFREQAPEKGLGSSNITGREVSKEEAKVQREENARLFAALLSNPLVGGFGYSRRETEQQSIDRARASTDVDSALYRHPDYQGEAAQGYRMAYDIYSLGMVLLEIALWVPIKSFLEAKKATRSSSTTGVVTVPLPTWDEVSKGIRRFHREESLAFRELAKERVERELAFRAGSEYRRVVEWCLTYADTGPLDPQDRPAALEFHDQVLTPLRRLAHAGPVG
ncbi:uncharacterized protein J7T54_000504 [Emericellopsis cladophorae]|uniref:Protein kinase domain-containing protein n=1 Tax=Emericellopsis cladophorae TaxID=2686198 RepID=A0A9Q0BB83_9HYPO|nr:uncharacterized protein J7T54_000504 [Emericellopsis cladophorae]KAI6778386.1 hypothetical protein J7T54_000504 [Emericellopsis cladophorae]